MEFCPKYTCKNKTGKHNKRFLSYKYLDRNILSGFYKRFD